MIIENCLKNLILTKSEKINCSSKQLLKRIKNKVFCMIDL